MKIKAISVVAKEWFDKVNGNSYFSANIQVNDDLIKLDWQYGYGTHYEYVAWDKIKEMYGIDTKLGMYAYCKENDIFLHTHKEEGCKKKDMVAFGK